MDYLFSIGSTLILPCWALMMFFPGWRWTQRIIQQPWIILPPALIYLVALIPEAATVLPAVARPEFGPIQALLGTPSGTVLAWNHMLAFDLFVGRWIYLDSREHGIAGWLTSVCLLLVLLAGPVGWISYGVARTMIQSRKAHLLRGAA